jgi:hypothetical protein
VKRNTNRTGKLGVVERAVSERRSGGVRAAGRGTGLLLRGTALLLGCGANLWLFWVAFAFWFAAAESGAALPQLLAQSVFVASGLGTAVAGVTSAVRLATNRSVVPAQATAAAVPLLLGGAWLIGASVAGQLVPGAERALAVVLGAPLLMLLVAARLDGAAGSAGRAPRAASRRD